MRRFSSIGSPLLSSIRREGSRSSPGASSCITTVPGWLVLSAIAPRASTEATTRAFVLGAMVSVYSYPETLGVWLARTTFLTSGGQGHWQELIEFSRITDFRLSQLRARVAPVRRRGELWFPVWMSPRISQLAPNRRLGRWLRGLAHVPLQG